jgi:hypothetical protein
MKCYKERKQGKQDNKNARFFIGRFLMLQKFIAGVGGWVPSERVASKYQKF